MYIYICVCVCVCTYIHLYTYRHFSLSLVSYRIPGVNNGCPECVVLRGCVICSHRVDGNAVGPTRRLLSQVSCSGVMGSTLSHVRCSA